MQPSIFLRKLLFRYQCIPVWDSSRAGG